MPDEAKETVAPPYTAFNFRVEITLPEEGENDGGDGGSETLCHAAFSECDGLEMTMQVKTIREGGNNARQIHLTGPVSYGQVTLRRGMTSNFDLWDWFDKVQQDGNRGLRADAEIIMLSSDRSAEQVRFLLERCLPVKMRAPALNAKDGLIAVEEMQMAYERMSLKRPESNGEENGTANAAGAGA